MRYPGVFYNVVSKGNGKNNEKEKGLIKMKRIKASLATG
jgi:hypothetical protein